MAWVKIDDGAPEHPKLVDLSDAAMALWIRALCYCARRRNDGLVPVGALRILSRAKVAAKVAAELVAAKLWDVCDDGYRVHDYQDYQPSKAMLDVTDKAASDAKREAGRAAGKRSGEARRGHADERNANQNGTIGSTFGSTNGTKRTKVQPPDPDPDPDPDPRSADPSEAHSPAADERALASIQVPAEGRDLVALARTLAAEGTSFGASVGERAALGKPFTQPQLETLRRIHDERASPRSGTRSRPTPAPHAPSVFTPEYASRQGINPDETLSEDDLPPELRFKS